MQKTRTISLTVLAFTLTACAQSGTDKNFATRLESNPLGIHSAPVQADAVTRQAQALEMSARGIVRASTVKGAVIGAAVGCGLGALTADASACAQAAVIGAGAGAAAGYVAGKRDVARRITLASPNNLVRNLRKANDQLDHIQTDLPNLLAQQEAELNALSLALAAQTISSAEHEKRVGSIRADRAALAEALTLTAQQAKRAAANLRTASAKGHTGLDWHIAATEQLSRESLSARSNITLL